jgi:hypothetical protein
MAFSDDPARNPKSEEDFGRSSKRPSSRLKARSLRTRQRRERKRSRAPSAAATSKTRHSPSFAIVEFERTSTAGTTSLNWGVNSCPRSNGKLRSAS